MRRPRLRWALSAAALALTGVAAMAQETPDAPQATPDAPADELTAAEADGADAQGDGISQPKTMSGMSILGNEEAPKSLVIIPWKSSELGEDIDLSDTLDDRARPVDRDVFLRELSFYRIREGE